jgi:hypothetical protein
METNSQRHSQKGNLAEESENQERCVSIDCSVSLLRNCTEFVTGSSPRIPTLVTKYALVAASWRSDTVAYTFRFSYQSLPLLKREIETKFYPLLCLFDAGEQGDSIVTTHALLATP